MARRKKQKTSSPGRKLEICFDLDDTCVSNGHRYNGPTWKCGLIVHQAMGFLSPRPAEVLALQQAKQMQLVEKHGFVIDVYPRSWVLAYRELCRKFGARINPTVTKKLFQAAAHFADGPYDAFEGVKEDLTKLRELGHRTHLITVGPQKLQFRKIRCAGLEDLFDHIHVSLRDKKRTLAMIAGDRPQDCVMVGDSKRSDMQPAKELGVITIWIPSNTWSYADVPVEPDYTIKSLHPDLVPLIGRITRRRPRPKSKKR